MDTDQSMDTDKARDKSSSRGRKERADGMQAEGKATLQIHVDPMSCVGNAMCVTLVPGVFAHNELRQSTVKDAAGGRRDEILEAAAHCPTAAITVTDRATGRTLFP